MSIEYRKNLVKRKVETVYTSINQDSIINSLKFISIDKINWYLDNIIEILDKGV